MIMLTKNHLRFLIPFLIILFIGGNSAYSQRKDFDLGILVGTMQYNGDVNMTKPFYSPYPAFSLMFRKNYNPHYSLRLGVSFGKLKADDSDFENLYQQSRAYYFDDTKMLEFSGMVEFNFFEVTTNKKDKNFSPFVVFGVGIMYIEDLSWYETFNIPMGIGVKYKLHPKLEIRTEWTFRKTFTDKLDHLAYEPTDGYLKYKQISFNQTKDWFSILGISLLFNFSDDKIPCNIYEMRSYPKRKRR